MSSVEAFLNAQANASPDMAPHYQTMRDLYERRLWHQLTMKLEEVVALPAFQTGDHLIQLYHNFIVDFEHKISPLKLGHLAVAVSFDTPTATPRPRSWRTSSRSSSRASSPAARSPSSTSACTSPSSASTRARRSRLATTSPSRAKQRWTRSLP